jgi:hypothetical protein
MNAGNNKFGTLSHCAKEVSKAHKKFFAGFQILNLKPLIKENSRTKKPSPSLRKTITFAFLSLANLLIERVISLRSWPGKELLLG